MRRGSKKGDKSRLELARRIRAWRNIEDMRANGKWWPVESEWNGRRRTEVR
jgi:hypothetical protein